MSRHENELAPVARSEIRWPALFDPASMIAALNVSGIAFTTISLLATLDMACMGAMDTAVLTLLVLRGMLLGTLGVAATDMLAWLLSRSFRSERGPGFAVRTGGGLADVGVMPPHEDGPVDEGDDAHVGAATGADERPGEEQTGDERGLYILAVTMKERCAASQAGFPEWGVLLWLAAVLAAALWVLRPADDYVPPSGWQHWPQTGPVLAVADDGHRLLVAGRNGLFELDPDVDKAVALASPGFQIPGLVHALARDPAGHLWVGHQAGVAIRDGDRWIHVDRFSDRPLIDVRAIAFEHNGIAWIGGNGGVWRVRWSVHGIASASDLSAEPVLTGVDTLSMLIDRDGGVWIGTRAGLHQRRSDDTEGWRLWATPDGLPNLQVAALMQDHSGRIWVGTGFHDRGGTILLERQSGVWRIAATLDPASLAAPKTRSLFQTDTGDIWIGSETDGLSVLGPDLRPKAIIEGNRLPNPEVTVIRAARNGGLWLGTLNGLIHVDDDAVGRLIH